MSPRLRRPAAGRTSRNRRREFRRAHSAAAASERRLIGIHRPALTAVTDNEVVVHVAAVVSVGVGVGAIAAAHGAHTEDGAGAPLKRK